MQVDLPQLIQTFLQAAVLWAIKHWVSKNEKAADELRKELDSLKEAKLRHELKIEELEKDVKDLTS